MKYRACTNNDKREILDALYEAWIKEPDQRLGQLIGNAIRTATGEEYAYLRTRLFLVEDTVLLDYIQLFVTKKKEAYQQ